jgi:hypothetical protein
VLEVHSGEQQQDIRTIEDAIAIAPSYVFFAVFWATILPASLRQPYSAPYRWKASVYGRMATRWKCIQSLSGSLKIVCIILSPSERYRYPACSGRFSALWFRSVVFTWQYHFHRSTFSCACHVV